MLGKTQQEFAGPLGLEGYQISDVERCNTMPSVFMVSSVVEFYGVDADWLLTGRGEPFPGQTTTTEPVAVADVLQETVYLCGACRGQVEPRVKRCRHCGAHLRNWPEDTQNTSGAE